MATEWQPTPVPDEAQAQAEPAVPQQPGSPGQQPAGEQGGSGQPAVPQQPGSPGQQQAGEQGGSGQPAPGRPEVPQQQGTAGPRTTQPHVGVPGADRTWGGEPAEAPPRRLASHPVVGFIPWILFWVIGGPSTWETATIAALIAAVLVMALSLNFRPVVTWSAGEPAPARPAPGQPAPAQPAPARPAPGPARPAPDQPAQPSAEPQSRLHRELAHVKLLDVATVVFFAALTIAAIVTSRHDVDELDRYAQAISSGALALISLGSLAVGHPFTVDYAKEQAPPRVWHTAMFKRINLVLTSVWTAVFAVTAVLGIVGQQGGAKGLRDWLNWYIPIILIFIAFRFTRWYPDQVRAEALADPF